MYLRFPFIFQQFATVEKVDFDETTLTATVGFKTRMDAEKVYF